MNRNNTKIAKKKTRAQLQQEVEVLQKEKTEREQADRKHVEILKAWARQDPDGTRDY